MFHAIVYIESWEDGFVVIKDFLYISPEISFKVFIVVEGFFSIINKIMISLASFQLFIITIIIIMETLFIDY
jgi:hypothetical protein